MSEIILQDLTVRRALPSDVVHIQEVYYKTWLATYPDAELGITVDDIEDWFKHRHNENHLRTSVERLIVPPHGEMMLVAVLEKKVVGLCRAIKHAQWNELRALYVLPAHHRQGLGTLLWKNATKHFQMRNPTFVHVATYNSNTIYFYEHLGFRATGKHWRNEEFRMKSGSIIPEMQMALPPQ